jgi:hypothetical protein
MKPCRICRRWFQPDPRVGGRQHACSQPDCQTARRQKTQASWRDRNPGYGIAWRLDQRAARPNRRNRSVYRLHGTNFPGMSRKTSSACNGLISLGLWEH